MIVIKNEKVLRSLLIKEYHPLLIQLLETFEKYTKGIVVTEGWREGRGVHSTDPCRGVDLRSWIYTPTQLTEIEIYINTSWVYDPNRPEMKCLLIHNVGKGEHIHLQVHPNTRRKML